MAVKIAEYSAQANEVIKKDDKTQIIGFQIPSEEEEEYSYEEDE